MGRSVLEGQRKTGHRAVVLRRPCLVILNGENPKEYRVEQKSGNRRY